MAALIFDEQLAGKRLIAGLGDRGLEAKTLGDYGVTGCADPDVVRQVDDRREAGWVLVTMDLTIIEDHPGFDWNRYAIAWVMTPGGLRGAQVETAKLNIVHRHAHQMVEQGRGDHHSYTHTQRYKSRPSLTTQLRRKG